ncbi:hypothetical protein BJ508DRAFT_364780 [Ascobolus immersus RN42]|uniref:Extracellular membrane protein CFEM domain-containing protein n=1 Tax=Ascobolus immersus RN42 TaxID=1160509 RepID=A0A3N4HSQ4_ASCIM|nr:hypothetical protein BJ508DRAFT_364780 [Ascobolus immersus RN42]
MKLTSIASVFALPLLAFAATNDTETSAKASNATSNENNSKSISTLTDFDSLITNWDACWQPCFREFLLGSFGSKELYPKCPFTGQKGEKVDWRCLCFDGADTDVKGSPANTTGEAILKKLETCLVDAIQKPICKGTSLENPGSPLEDFEGYCVQRFGANGTLQDREELERLAKANGASPNGGNLGLVGLSVIGIIGFLSVLA